MSALVSTVSKVLKDRYIAPLNRQLNDEVMVMQLLDIDSKAIDLDGNQAVVPLHKGRTNGIGARAESDTLPGAGFQPFEKVVFDLKYLYGRAQFSGQAIQKTKTDAGAFIRVITEELDRLREDLALDLARQVYGDGSGTIAIINPGVASATQTLADAEATEKGYLYPNMTVDIGTLANPVASATAKIISSVSGTTLILTTSATTTTNDVVSRAGNNQVSSVSNEITGLQQLVAASNNSVGGLNSATAGNEYWRNIQDTAGGAISLQNLMILVNKVKAKGAQPGNLQVISTDGIARRLFETAEFKSNVRFVDNDRKLNAGFSEMSFAAGGASVRLATDRLAPWGKVYFVDKKFIKVFSPGGWSFLDRDGLTIRWVSDKDAFQAVLFRYMNLGTGRRNTSGVMSGLTDTGY